MKTVPKSRSGRFAVISALRASADALRGIEAAHPQLWVDHAAHVVYRADSPAPAGLG